MRILILALLVSAGLHAAADVLTGYEEILGQWPFGSTVRLTVAQDNKPAASDVVFGKMQVAIPELAKAGFKEPIPVISNTRRMTRGKVYTVLGEAKAADGRTLKLELRCDPNRKQVLGVATITDAEGNAKSLTIDTPAEETKEKGKSKK